MKKLFALFVMTVMCVSLVACGESEQPADNNNSQAIHDNQQADSNNSQTVHEEPQVNNNDAQQEQSNNINDNEMYTEIDISEVDVVGTWKNVSADWTGATVIFNEDGIGMLSYAGEERNGMWEKKDAEIVLNFDSGEMRFTARENNGIIEMIREEDSLIFLSEQDFENTVECVEITLDNWQQYFEIKPCALPYEADDTEYLRVGVVMMLKDEYVNNQISLEGNVDVFFDGEYRCPVEYDCVTGEVILGTPYTQEECNQKGYSGEYFGTRAVTPIDFDSDISIMDFGRNDCYELGGNVGFPRDKWKIDGDVITVDAFYYETIEITRIQGNLYLKK